MWCKEAAVAHWGDKLSPCPVVLGGDRKQAQGSYVHVPKHCIATTAFTWVKNNKSSALFFWINDNRNSTKTMVDYLCRQFLTYVESHRFSGKGLQRWRGQAPALGSSLVEKEHQRWGEKVERNSFLPHSCSQIWSSGFPGVKRRASTVTLQCCTGPNT